MNTKIKQSKEIISKLPTESVSHKMDGEKRIFSSMFEIYGRVQGKYIILWYEKIVIKTYINVLVYFLLGVYFRKVSGALNKT